MTTNAVGIAAGIDILKLLPMIEGRRLYSMSARAHRDHALRPRVLLSPSFAGSFNVRGLLVASLIAAGTAIAPLPATAQPTPPHPVATADAQAAEARETLMRMSTFLGSAQAF